MDQSISKQFKIKLSWSKIDQSLSKTFGLWEGGSAKVFGEIKNWGRWSKMVALILPEIMPFKMTFTKIIVDKGSGMTFMLIIFP